MFTLAYGHALRSSEIVSLTLDDVRGGKIVCRRGKSASTSIEVLRAHEIDAWPRGCGNAVRLTGLFSYSLPGKVPACTATSLSPVP